MAQAVGAAKCEEDGRSPATLTCLQCGVRLCARCDAAIHSFRVLAAHTREPMAAAAARSTGSMASLSDSWLAELDLDEDVPGQQPYKKDDQQPSQQRKPALSVPVEEEEEEALEEEDLMMAVEQVEEEEDKNEVAVKAELAPPRVQVQHIPSPGVLLSPTPSPAPVEDQPMDVADDEPADDDNHDDDDDDDDDDLPLDDACLLALETAAGHEPAAAAAPPPEEEEEEELDDPSVPRPSEEHLTKLREVFGHPRFKPLQWAIIHAVMIERKVSGENGRKGVEEANEDQTFILFFFFSLLLLLLFALRT